VTAKIFFERLLFSSRTLSLESIVCMFPNSPRSLNNYFLISVHLIQKKNGPSICLSSRFKKKRFIKRKCHIDTCMANGPNMRGNPTAHRTQSSLPVSQALAPCARQPGFRARRQALIFSPKSALYKSRHALGETLHVSILPAHDARV